MYKETNKEDQEKLSNALDKVKNRILAFSGKRGVGKSSVAANLALALSQKGMQIGLMDIDIHGPNLAKMFGVEVSLLVSRKAVTFARKLNLKILGIFENISGLIFPYYTKEMNLFNTSGEEKITNELKVPLRGKTPVDPQIVRSCDDVKPFVFNKTFSKT